MTTNGPLAAHPYYLRITKDGNPNAGTTYNIGDSGPNGVDQRRVVDTSYLELVRLGVRELELAHDLPHGRGAAPSRPPPKSGQCTKPKAHITIW